MDEDIFPSLSSANIKRTFARKAKKVQRPLTPPEVTKDADVTEPLTTKAAIQLLLAGTLKSKVCRYCLNVTPGLSELDQIMNIAGSGNVYKVTVRDIVASFHPFKVADNPDFPDKICQKCLDRALHAYIFTQQCEQAERAMYNCFDDMYEKFEKLDPIDRPKKRGRQKLNPNFNVLHAEHKKVIDYAEPIINIINIGAETVTNEPELNELECKKCWQVLPNMESMLNHEKIHPKTMWYHCRLCGKSFPKRNQLKKHNHRVHVLGKEIYPLDEKEFKCKECNHVTDNFVIHLQHVEKHRFRNVMEHLIEKRMDKLCVVCFNKGTKMMDLDNMVCVHGGHPELMGDKTLYTILASTLPNPKSYKYQELIVPSNAHIMTISKKRKNNEARKEELELLVNSSLTHHGINTIDFSKEKVKNNPNECGEYSNTLTPVKNDALSSNTINTNNTSNIFASNTKVFEVDDINDIVETCSDAEDNMEYKQFINTSVDTDKDSETNMMKELTGDLVLDQNKSIIDVSEIENTGNEYLFSSPELVETEYVLIIERKEIEEFKFLFSEPEVIGSSNIITSEEERVEEETNNGDNEKLKENNCDKCWLFKNTNRVCKDHGNVISSDTGYKQEKNKIECKFCWIFKVMDKCDYCHKPFEKKTDSYPIPNKNQIAKEQTKNVEIIKHLWQCSICLSYNTTDRFSCHCCGTVRSQDDNIKFNFGNNNSVFNTKYLDQNDSDNAAVNINTEKLKLDMIVAYNEVIEKTDEVIMDMETQSEEKSSPNNQNHVQSMDIDTDDSGFENINTLKNDFEVEMNPISTYRGPQWCEEAMLNVDMESPMDTNMIGTISTRTNIQFNIGNCPKEKPRRILRATQRNRSKALHK